MSKKVYIVGGNIYFDYINWILDMPDWGFTTSLEEADLVFFTGGEDVSPWVYGSPKNIRTSNNEFRDREEIKIYQRAIELGKHLIGVCRGAQFICAMQEGGHLIQHMRHPGQHLIKTYDGKEFVVTSSHHQNQYLGYMKPEDYKLIGWAEGLSQYHLNGTDEELELIDNKEPDIVYYPKTKALCYQNHPEWMPLDHPTVKYCQQLVTEYLT